MPGRQNPEAYGDDCREVVGVFRVLTTKPTGSLKLEAIEINGDKAFAARPVFLKQSYMSAHSKFSPSSAKRWLTCPGSMSLPVTEQKSSVYAAEGSAAHLLAQRCQLIGASPDHYHGDLINVIDEDTGESDGVFEVTDEMIRGVRLFLDAIDSYKRKDSVSQAERRVFHAKNQDFGGTIDSQVVTPSESALTMLCLLYTSPSPRD